MERDSAQLLGRADLRVAMDHGQVYVYDAAIDLAAHEYRAFLGSLEDATASGFYVGTCDGLVNVLSPCQWNFDTPFAIETWSAQPSTLSADWEHAVELDLDAPSGRIVLAASGGGAEFGATISPWALPCPNRRKGTRLRKPGHRLVPDAALAARHRHGPRPRPKVAGLGPGVDPTWKQSTGCCASTLVVGTACDRPPRSTA